MSGWLTLTEVRSEGAKYARAVSDRFGETLERLAEDEQIAASIGAELLAAQIRQLTPLYRLARSEQGELADNLADLEHDLA
jgi:hypothetical protein